MGYTGIKILGTIFLLISIALMFFNFVFGAFLAIISIVIFTVGRFIEGEKQSH